MKSLLTKLKIYQKELEEIDEELQTLPNGYLAKKGNFYYHAINKKEVGVTKKPEVIRLLCRKKYILARKAQLIHNLSCLPQDISKIDDTTPRKMIQSFPNAYQEVPISYFYHPSMQAWLAEDYKGNPYPQGEWNYHSKNGTPVRSKSECLIANQLEDNGIDYRYDAPTVLGKQTKYPDFTIKHPFNGKLILWEHFGALNQPGYEQKMNEKMDLYLTYGYVAFDTIIYTFEFQVKNVLRIQNLIEDVIL